MFIHHWFFTPHAARRIPHFLYALLLCVCLLNCANPPPSRDAWIEATSQRNLGIAYLDRNDFDSAVGAFEAVCRLAPDEPAGYANLALAHLERQEPDRAAEAIRRALDLDEEAAEVRSIEADVERARGEEEKALGILERAVQRHPANVVLRYRYLTLLARLRGPEHRREDTIPHLRAILDHAPDNLAALAELAAALVQAGRFDEADTCYQRMAAMAWPFSEHVGTYLEATIAAVKNRQAGEAQRNAGILGNLLKVDPAYQTARDALGDPSAPSPPLYEFRTAPAGLARTSADSLVPMGFVVAMTWPVSPGSADAALADCDEDGRPDLALADGGRVRLYRNEQNAFVDVTDRAGLAAIRDARGLVFGDMDNDGDMDLYVVGLRQDALYRNDGRGVFTPAPKAVPVRPAGRSPGALMADYDHDGDLDMLVTDGPEIRFYRNAEEGRFEERTQEVGMAGQTQTPAGGISGRSAAYGDFDLDGALDMFVARPDGHHLLYRNARQGRFIEWSSRANVRPAPGAQTVAAGDFNNDGALDLFLAGAGGAGAQMFWNDRSGRFDRDSTPAPVAALGKDMNIAAAAPLDFDNDGFLDLAAAGTPSGSGPGLRLVRNLGSGRFEDASSLLPAAVDGPCVDVKAEDYDADGDIDLVVLTPSQAVLLRNDGGNANRWLKVTLNAVLTGGSKNNFYGIGSTIEVNTETHYQSMLVTAPVTHFGLGRADRADVYRVIWSNGIPQNTVLPEPNTLVLEQQRLKGSCPSLYAWNGREYVFVTHLMTRSAIGALTETGAPAPPDAADDYVKIRGDQLQARDGAYTLRIVEELWDTVYMDRLRLLAVDHPETTDIFVNEIYVPPPYPPFAVYTATRPRLPVAAVDRRGRDILPRLARRDSLYVGDYAPGRYQGAAETHAITLDLGDLSGAKAIRLYLCGWIMPVEPSANLALSQRPAPGVIAPYLEVPDAQGRWRTVIPYTGFPSGEHKTMMIDLTGKFLTDDYRVRITTNLEIYWSEAFFTVDEPADLPMTITPLEPLRADLRYRGFSREYRAAPYGPYLRDYAEASAEPQWLPFTGYRTRYGDVTPLLQASDDRYAVYSSGEEIAVAFDGRRLPALPAGWTRDYVLHADGWLKEGDLNTDTAATIEPLPFHGMSRYPYGPEEYYPVSAEHRAYLREYNTRWVSQRAFRDRIRRYGDAAPALR